MNAAIQINNNTYNIISSHLFRSDCQPEIASLFFFTPCFNKF